MRANLFSLSIVQRRWVKKAVRWLFFVLTAAMVTVCIHHLHWKQSWQISVRSFAGSRHLGSVQAYNEIELISGTKESRRNETVRTEEPTPTTGETSLSPTGLHSLPRSSPSATNSSATTQKFRNMSLALGHKSSLTTRTTCQQNYFLLILVASAPANFDQRRIIRQTWADDSFTRNPRWKTVFLLGQTRISGDSEKLQREEALYGDLIRGDYYEDYWNQTFKVEMGFEWAARYCNFTFLLKADDDVFINVPAVIKLLNNPKTPKERLYLGFLFKNPQVFRKGKWGITVEEYNGTHYPAYCAGPGYILSRDVVISFVDIINTIPKFRVDDVYVGMLAKKAGVTGMHNAGFQTPPFSSKKCVLLDNTLVRHNAVGQCLLDLFEKAKLA